MLEQIIYRPPRTSERKQVVYQVGDLENLSATALYYGNSGNAFGGNGFSGISKGDMAKFKIVATPLMNVEPIIEGMILPGDLTIKKVGKNTISLQQDFGGVGNIYSLHPDGHGAIRLYGLGEGKAKEKKTNSW